MSLAKERIKRTGGAVLAMGAAMLAGVGCGVDKQADQGVERSVGALGSTQTQKKITSLSQITDTFGNYLLDADINMSGKTWVRHEFYGTFDGGGHTISNLTLTDPGDGASFMNYIQGAVIRRLKLINVKATSSRYAAGVAATAIDSLIESVSVEGTISCTGCSAAGGIVASMLGGDIVTSYFKGSVTGAAHTGGLVGDTNLGFNPDLHSARSEINRSYAQGTGAPGTQLVTAKSTGTTAAGGIVGYQFSGRVQDVYAVGNVTGNYYVGGIVGFSDCDDSNPWILDHAVYRGDVVDRINAGRAGTLGSYNAVCADRRWERCYWDSTLDPSGTSLNNGSSQLGAASVDLRSPTALNAGVYCQLVDIVPGRCGDDGFTTDIWNAGTNAQHQFLKGLPGPNNQPL